MKASLRVGCLILTAILLSPAAADPPAAESTNRPSNLKFVVYSSEEDAKFASSLFRVLRGKEKASRFAKANTIEKATESEADVIVLVMTGNQLPKLEPKTVEALKKRKIIGFGSGAARLFGQIGLEINLGACAHFGAVPPKIKIAKSELLGEPKSKDSIPIVEQLAEAKPEPERDADPDAEEPAPPAPATVPVLDNFAVFLPPSNTESSGIDVLARWADDPNYAPIVRQGNCILIGVPVPATRWTAAYTNFIQDACQALRERKPQDSSAVRRNLTKPGFSTFKLAKGGSTQESFSKTFYFRFSTQTKFTARLEHSGSDNVMMLFMGEGQNENRLHWTRQDARKGEALEISADISPTDIEALADRYWTLNITNFGMNSPVDCKLTIKVEMP